MLVLFLSVLVEGGSEEEHGRDEKRPNYVCTEFTATVLAGVRGDAKSERAMNAATANATVVKKPKTFWMRTIEVCMLGGSLNCCSCYPIFSRLASMAGDVTIAKSLKILN